MAVISVVLSGSRVMIIYVNSQWRLKSDFRQWHVQQKRAGKWESVTYWSTAESAVNDLYRRGVRCIPGEDVKKLLSKVDNLRSDVRIADRKMRGKF